MFIACPIDKTSAGGAFLLGGPGACSPAKFFNFGSSEKAFPGF